MVTIKIDVAQRHDCGAEACASLLGAHDLVLVAHGTE